MIALHSRFRSHEAHKGAFEFEKHFGVRFQNFWQGWVIGLDNCLLIDLAKFDQYFTEKYNYFGSKYILLSAFLLKINPSKTIPLSVIANFCQYSGVMVLFWANFQML